MASWLRAFSIIETRFLSVCGQKMQVKSNYIPTLVFSLRFAYWVGIMGPFAVRIGSGLIKDAAYVGLKIIIDWKAPKSSLNLLVCCWPSFRLSSLSFLVASSAVVTSPTSALIFSFFDLNTGVSAYSYADWSSYGVERFVRQTVHIGGGMAYRGNESLRSSKQLWWHGFLNFP